MRWGPIGRDFIHKVVEYCSENIVQFPLVLTKHLNHDFLLASNNMVRGVFPTQVEDFALPFVEFQDISLDPALPPT